MEEGVKDIVVRTRLKDARKSGTIRQVLLDECWEGSTKNGLGGIN